MLRLGSEKEELRVVADQIGAPTSAALIAAATATAITRWWDSDGGRAAVEGTYHMVSTGQTSWHGFAATLLARAAKEGLIAKAPAVLPISTAEFPTRAARPAYSVLNNALFQKTFGFSLPTWESSLDDVLLALKSRR
jgi:dTDP-4-dehydrorhamnose reductase